MPPPEPHPPRLHVVTGKGGTGKTTVAAALALALASGGRRSLLVEVEGRQGIAQLFDVPPLPYAERRVAVAPDGGDVAALAVDPEAALLEYLEMFYRLGRAGKALERLGAIDFATTIAPGLRDVLLVGKVYEAVRRRATPARPPRGGRPAAGRRRDDGEGLPAYDAVVLDAPPTGRITRFLGVGGEVAGLARVGPIRGQAESVSALLRSPVTTVHLVTTLEEMPVQETADAVEELAAAGLSVGAVVVNAVREPLLDPPALAAVHAGLDPAMVRAGLDAAGLPTEPALVDALVAGGVDHGRRVALQVRERERVGRLGRPVVELPLLGDGVDLGGLYALADVLRASVVVPDGRRTAGAAR